MDLRGEMTRALGAGQQQGVASGKPWFEGLKYGLRTVKCIGLTMSHACREAMTRADHQSCIHGFMSHDMSSHDSWIEGIQGAP